MLVLSKKPGEKLVVAHGVTVTVMEALNGQVKLGVEDPTPSPTLQGQVGQEEEEAAFREHWLGSAAASEGSNPQIVSLEATPSQNSPRSPTQRRRRIRQHSTDRLVSLTIRRDRRPAGRLKRQTDQNSRRFCSPLPSEKLDTTTSPPMTPAAPAPEKERDASIRTAALEAIRSTHYRPLWNLSCEVSEGVISLLGTVPSFYLKQLAQELVLKLGCVSGIVNLVDVQAAPTAT
jgi:sRNA-binding carbon storage regulator CsrA